VVDQQVGRRPDGAAESAQHRLHLIVLNHSPTYVSFSYRNPPRTHAMVSDHPRSRKSAKAYVATVSGSGLSGDPICGEWITYGPAIFKQGTLRQASNP